MTRHPLTLLITDATTDRGRATAERLQELGHRIIATGQSTVGLWDLTAEHGIPTLQFDPAHGDSVEDLQSGIHHLTDGRGVNAVIHCGPSHGLRGVMDVMEFFTGDAPETGPESVASGAEALLC